MAIYQKITLVITLIINSISISFAAENLYTFSDHQQEARYHQLLLETRCMVCENQSLMDSHTPLAEDLRQEIYHQIIAGKSNQDVKAFLVERYGATVLYDPPLQGNTLFLWLAPIVLFLLGICVWLWKRK